MDNLSHVTDTVITATYNRCSTVARNFMGVTTSVNDHGDIKLEREIKVYISRNQIKYADIGKLAMSDIPKCEMSVQADVRKLFASGGKVFF